MPAKLANKSRKRVVQESLGRLESRDGHKRAAVAIWCDRIVLAGIACLMVFSPLAIGSVNPWAFGSVEAIIFVLTVVWMARLAVADKPQSFSAMRPLLMPAGSFIALILFQLVPLPPAAMRVLSPSTYRLYATSLPGWPGRDPYPLRPSTGSGREGLRESNSGAAAYGTISSNGEGEVSRSLASGWRDAVSRWRPLSIAPGLTATAALKVIAYACLFFLVLFYPMPRYRQSRGEGRFCRRLLKTGLIAGLLIGCVGLLEQAFWNGAIMWLYVPYDWGAPRPGFDPRASGPFVNPNHFAAYLNLILPLALAGALFPTFLSRRSSSRGALRLFCLAVAAVLVSALALSLSRGGWFGGLLGASIVIWLALRANWRRQGERTGIRPKLIGALYVLLLICIVAGAALYTAPSAPIAVNSRLEATINEPDFGTRAGYWAETLGLIRDYPVLGVGLGCFQDLFPRYQRPPWSPFSVREAHNDYLELIADAGIAGFVLLLWFCLAAGTRIYRGLRTLPAELAPVVVALVAGLAAMALQECFDFALQMPCNAVLFAIFLAIALRLSGAGRGDGAETRYGAAKVRPAAVAISAAAVLLIVAALRQDQTPYPYLAALPRDARAARALILEHPACSTPHLWYAAFKHGSAAEQMRELAIAASLDPINPLILDRYAQALAADGRTGTALAELTRSVFVYPSMGDHFYLQADMIPWLSLDERKAIEAGFGMAVAHRLSGASSALAAFYAALHHDAAEAQVLAAASATAEQPARRVDLLLEAGSVYARAGDTARAAAAFKQAARIEPANPKPYEYLVSKIFAPEGDIDSAKAVVQKGLKNGADPFALYLSLARVYEQVGDYNGAEAALLKAARMRPDGRYDCDTLMRLADLEARAGHFDRAVSWMRQAIEIRPGSADVLYRLALAEEADYEYGQALRDLAKALKLEPGNVQIKEHYAALVQMIAVHSGRNHQ